MAAATVVFVAGMSASAAASCPSQWPDWEQFKARFISVDGRVIDSSTPRAVTVSEGQAYALFFALVADDRRQFGRLLEWTENNLAAGDLTRNLPAWQWGRRDDGQWAVLDANPAADADVWLVYALDQAGRLWQEPYYRSLSAVIARQVFARETAELGGLGLGLLPAPEGFHPAPDLWRLNPSYLPPMLLRALARSQPERPWGRVLDSSEQVLVGAAPGGLAPDWVEYRPGRGFSPDSITRATGSYDAIRVYLWLGLMAEAAPERPGLVRHFAPMLELLRADGWPPETIDALSGRAQGRGPVGFAAALLPFAVAAGDHALAVRLAQQVAQQRDALRERYYDTVLMLFGMGWFEGRYRFAAEGDLVPAWSRAC
jgi:endoglucanase